MNKIQSTQQDIHVRMKVITDFLGTQPNAAQLIKFIGPPTVWNQNPQALLMLAPIFSPDGGFTGATTQQVKVEEFQNYKSLAATNPDLLPEAYSAGANLIPCIKVTEESRGVLQDYYKGISGMMMQCGICYYITKTEASRVAQLRRQGVQKPLGFFIRHNAKFRLNWSNAIGTGSGPMGAFYFTFLSEKNGDRRGFQPHDSYYAGIAAVGARLATVGDPVF